MTTSFDDTLDEDGNEETSTTESNPMRQLRKHATSLEKKLNSTEKELEELRAWRTEREAADRVSKVNEAFKAAGLNEKAAKLFAAVNPEGEPTAEAVKSFAEEFGLAPAPAANDDGSVDESAEEQATGSTGFAPTEGGTPPVARTYSSKELAEAARKGDYTLLEKAVNQIAADPRKLKLEHPEFT